MSFLWYLEHMVKQQASDLYFTTGAPVNIRIEGRTLALKQRPLAPGEVARLAYSVMDGDRIRAFEQELELDMAILVNGLGRFRINVFRQRGEVAMVVRHIKAKVPSIAELGLPQLLERLVVSPRGLIVVVGATGSGKSTTLASMIDHRSAHRSGHILTIEEPIEFFHRHKRSIVNQREVGVDTHSFANALKRAMREAPDVILLGETRDRETLQQLLAYADTGHLCLTTLHASNAHQALERMLKLFPDRNRPDLLMTLSLNLCAIVAQRLVTTREGTRTAVVEILLNTPYMADLIREGNFVQVREAVERGSIHGMQSFDQELFRLYRQGRITSQTALENADSATDMGVRIRLADSGHIQAPDSYDVLDGTHGIH